LFRLYHNEREIDELNGELAHKNQSLDKENRRLQKVEDELKDRKKEHGKLMKDITKLEQQLKDSVCCRAILVRYRNMVAREREDRQAEKLS